MDFLRAEKDRIVDSQGKPVYLRGFAVGGWMNMEHFMNGFPGAEHQMRAVMAQELGARMSEFFFNRLLDYFFTEDDVVFIRSLGATVVRLAVNYRHFESDEQPFEYLEAGFSRLNQALGAATPVRSLAALDQFKKKRSAQVAAKSTAKISELIGLLATVNSLRNMLQKKKA